MTSAWVTLVMLDDEFVKGAICLAESIKLTKSKYPVWCMYAKISDEAITTLKKHFDKVIEVPLIDVKVSRAMSNKVKPRYAKWNNYSLTACNVMNPMYNLDTCVLLNADVLFRYNIDDLFDIQSPAAMFSSPWSDRIFKTSDIVNYYGKIKHLQRVTRESLRLAITDGFAVTGNMYVWHPSDISWKHFEMLIASGYFGNEECYASGSEQMFATIMHDLYDKICPRGPVNIGPKYCCNVGKAYWIHTKAQITEAYTYHFCGCHPWEVKHQKTQYPDVKEWLDLYNHITQSDLDHNEH